MHFSFLRRIARKMGLIKWFKTFLLKFPLKRINRNQWRYDKNNPYHKEMNASLEEIRAMDAKYAARIEFTIKIPSGRVLELGAGSGNITRWIILKPEVSKVVAVEGFEEGFEWLKKANLPRVDPRKMKMEALHFGPEDCFDSVIVTELIEHLYPDEERKMISAIRPYLAPNARWVVSTPIGFLPDPHHVRGFEKEEFRAHLEVHYGPVSEVDYSSGYSQVAWGFWSENVR